MATWKDRLLTTDGKKRRNKTLTNYSTHGARLFGEAVRTWRETQRVDNPSPIQHAVANAKYRLGEREQIADAVGTWDQLVI